MSRFCLLLAESPYLPPTGFRDLLARVLPLGAQARADGHSVTLLHLDLTGEPLRSEVRAAAEAGGLDYVPVRGCEPPFDAPLYPATATHQFAHAIAARLGREEPDVVVAAGQLAAAAITLVARETTGKFSHTTFTLILTVLPQARVRRETGDAGELTVRDGLIHDFLERRALALADAVLAADPAIASRLRDTGEIAPDRLHSLDWNERAWTSLLRHPTPRRSPRAPAALPRVTVCVPYYEQPGFLAEALDSLAAQTLPPHEVVVIDDGSPSAAAAEAYAAEERRHAGRGWRFLRQANAGPAAARNRLAAEATGEALVFCDADNRFRPAMVATLARALAQTGADAVTCAFRAFPSGPAASSAEAYVFAPLGPCRELALVENVLGDTNFIVRREVFRKLGGFPESNRSASEDWQFLLSLLAAGGRLETVPEVLFDYRLVPASHARRNREILSAMAAVEAEVQAAGPVWRELWPHLYSAIRDPRLPQLEHRLERLRQEKEAAEIGHRATLAESQQRFEQREAELANAAAVASARLREANARLQEAEARLRRQHWELELQRAAGEQAARDRATLRDQAAGQEEQIAALTRELAGTRATLESAVAERDAKIRRMQASWSWQATSPARALRRAVVDPWLRPNASPGGAAGRASTPVAAAIDRPAFWDAAPVAGTIAGWCLREGTAKIRGVRATLDGVVLHGRTDLPRPDVAAAHGLGAEAANCGFEFHYRLEPDAPRRLVIETQAADGTWHPLREGLLQGTHQPRDARDYTAWVQTFSTVTPEVAARLRQRLAALPANRRPLISVVMPVYNVDERWLTRAIESVREQVYEQWELCIADDASTRPHVRAVLERWQATDPRIRVVFRSGNGHISAASNSALELAAGEFVALLDHDDELSPDALAEVVLWLADRPGTDLVFSDEDKIDENGRRFSPYFKPDYLPDLLRGQNCISHLSVYRTEVVRRVGGFRAGYEGSQDWDLSLRVVDAIAPDRIGHIPKVLYHWRAISGSTAVAVGEKSYTVTAAQRALSDHLERRGIAAQLRRVPGDHWQIVYPVPEKAPLVSIIIPTRNAANLVRTCVGSIIARTDYPNYEIIVVDNRSDDPAARDLLARLEAEDHVRVLSHDAPFNFSAINNRAAAAAQGEVLCFLNNDMEVITGRWLDELVSHALRPEIGAVGAMLYYPDATIQHAGVVLGLGGVANHAFLRYPHGTDGYMNRARLAQNYSAVTAACLAVRRSAFEQVGGFNERDLAVAFNDIDLCLRLRAAGYWNLWTPFAELYHHESASRGNDHAPEHQARFQREIEYMRRTWGPLLDRDPAYNPNLSVDLLGWQLAWPPRVSP